MTLFLKNSFLLICGTFAMKGVGFFREAALAYYYGVGEITDAYIVAQTIPVTLFEYVSYAVSIAFIPIYIGICKDKGNEEANVFVSNLCLMCILIALSLNIFLQVYTQEVIGIFAHGFSMHTAEMAEIFLRIIACNVCFLVIADILNAYLQIKKQFLQATFVSLPYNIVIIISIVVAWHYDSLYLAYGITGASVVKCLYIYVLAYMHKFKFVFKLSFVGCKEFWLMSIPIMGVVIVEQMNTVFDKTIASGLMVGAISLVSYAEKINSMVRQLLARPLGIVVFPQLCESVAAGDGKELKEAVTASARLTIIIIVPATFGIVAISDLVIDLLYKHGEFTEYNKLMTAGVLSYYSLGLVWYSLNEILGRVLYAYGNMRTTFLNVAICVCVNVVFNVYLTRFMGVNGLALATSLAGFASTIHFCCVLSKKINYYMSDYFLLLKLILQVTGLSLAMWGGLYFLRYMCGFNSIIVLVPFGVLFYVGGAYATGIFEVVGGVKKLIVKCKF